MSTALELLTRAFREGNLIPIGQVPNANEQAEGLALLNGYMLSQFGNAVGDQLIEWPVPQNQRTASTDRTYPLLPGADTSLVPTYNTLVPENSRVVWDGSTQTIYMPSKPQDGAIVAIALGSGKAAADVGPLTVDGNGRLIAGSDTQTYDKVTFAPVKWFYRADTAGWQLIAPLALNDAMIFPDEFDDLWVCAVNIRLAPRYGKTVSTATAARGSEMISMLQARYFQSRPGTAGGEELRPAFESFRSTTSWMGT